MTRSVNPRGIAGHQAIEKFLDECSDGDTLQLELPQTLMAALPKLTSEIRERALRRKKTINIEATEA